MTELLLLRAEEPDDLILLSACVQDMAVKAGDIGWSPRARRLALIGNRFRWEDAARGPGKGGSATRIRSALRFDFVGSVQRRNWPAAPDTVLPLLAITFDDATDDQSAEDQAGASSTADGQPPEHTPATGVTLLLSFGGGAALRLQQEVLDATLEDLSGPWGATTIPDHDNA